MLLWLLVIYILWICIVVVLRESTLGLLCFLFRLIKSACVHSVISYDFLGVFTGSIPCVKFIISKLFWKMIKVTFYLSSETVVSNELNIILYLLPFTSNHSRTILSISNYPLSETILLAKLSLSRKKTLWVPCSCQIIFEINR